MENEDTGRGLSGSQAAHVLGMGQSSQGCEGAHVRDGRRHEHWRAGGREGERAERGGQPQTLRPGEGSRGAPGGAVALRAGGGVPRCSFARARVQPPRHGAATVRPAARLSRPAAPAPTPLLFLLFGCLRPVRAGFLPRAAPAGLPAWRDPRRVRLLPRVRSRRG